LDFTILMLLSSIGNSLSISSSSESRENPPASITSIKSLACSGIGRLNEVGFGLSFSFFTSCTTSTLDFSIMALLFSIGISFSISSSSESSENPPPSITSIKSLACSGIGRLNEAGFGLSISLFTSCTAPSLDFSILALLFSGFPICFSADCSLECFIDKIWFSTDCKHQITFVITSCLNMVIEEVVCLRTLSCWLTCSNCFCTNLASLSFSCGFFVLFISITCCSMISNQTVICSIIVIIVFCITTESPFLTVSGKELSFSDTTFNSFAQSDILNWLEVCPTVILLFSNFCTLTQSSSRFLTEIFCSDFLFSVLDLSSDSNFSSGWRTDSMTDVVTSGTISSSSSSSSENPPDSITSKKSLACSGMGRLNEGFVSTKLCLITETDPSVITFCSIIESSSKNVWTTDSFFVNSFSCTFFTSFISS